MGEPLFFVELLLHWATSSLRHLFPPLPLLWAATYLGYLPPSYLCSFCNPILLCAQPVQCVLQRPAAILLLVKNLSRSCYNAFSNCCNPTCQVPGASKHSLCFAACSPANALCHSWLQTLIAGVSQQIDQHPRSADNGDDSALLRSSQLFKFVCELLATAWCTFCRPHFLKVLRSLDVFCFFGETKLWLQSRALFAALIFQKCFAGQFLNFFHANRALAYTLCQQLTQIEAGNRGNITLLRRPQQPHYTTPKTQGFEPESRECFHPRAFTRFRTVTFPNYDLDDGWLTWWWY